MSGGNFFGGQFFGGGFFGALSPDVFGRSGLGGDDVPRQESPHKGWDRKAYESKKARDDAVEATLRRVYADLTGEDQPISVLARVDAIVKPEAKRVERDAPLVIDWQAMARHEQRAVALMRLWQEEEALKREIDDDDDLLAMMH